MKIFVTGATSGLGRNATEWLLEAGHQVVACGRDRRIGSWLGTEFVALDLVNASGEELRQAMDGCDAVWHCAARSSPWGAWDAFYQDNVTATEKLARVAGESGIPRFIHISTPAIYFDFHHHRNIPESQCAAHFANHYSHTKFLAEQSILSLLKTFPDTNFQILRPRGLFGAHDRVIVPRLLTQINRDSGVLRLPRGGHALLDLTFVLNVVEAMFLATEKPGLTSGAIYNITNQQPQRLVDMLHQLLRRELRIEYRIQSVPYPVLHGIAAMMEATARITKKEPMLTRYSVGAVNFDMTLDNQRAIDELGYTPGYTLAKGIALTGEWLRKEGYGEGC